MNTGPDNPNDEREVIIGTWVSRLTWDRAVNTIIGWAQARTSRYVCVSNVHAVVTARSDNRLRAAINGADMATPDGMPLAWLISKRGDTHQERISGTELTHKICAEAARHGVPIYLFGSTGDTLRKLQATLLGQYPQLTISGSYSPPFRPLSQAEDDEVVGRINSLSPGIVFVGLGCPKQEIWMAEHRGRIHGVMIGIGAAFEFIAGTVRRPPLWMQKTGMEWLGRLLMEPRRLWKRYFVTNSIFIALVAKEFLR